MYGERGSGRRSSYPGTEPLTSESEAKTLTTGQINGHTYKNVLV